MSEFRTQNEMLLDHLQSGKAIVMLDALGLYGIAHLPRRIKDLKEAGHIIKDDWIKVTKANGKIATVKQYTYADENWQRAEIKAPQFKL